MVSFNTAISPTVNKENCANLFGIAEALLEKGQRIQKVLEGANIKLSSVATDILVVSGRLMLNAILDGVDNPEELAGLVKKRMKSKQEDLEHALFGSIGFHQKMMLKVQLSHIDFLDPQIAELNDEVQQRMQPYEEDIVLLYSNPGIGRGSCGTPFG